MNNNIKTIKEQIKSWLEGFQDGSFGYDTVIEGIDGLYTDPSKKELPKLLGNLLEKAFDNNIDHSQLPVEYEDDLEAFLEDYYEDEQLGADDIVIDCKIDAALPKESLQENLQLLIDREGLLWLSKTIEAMLRMKEVVGS